ncbi:hypothetical protein [Streptomyces alboniger]|uniref:Uncharacterized protein n=1 Tax=Streptomyces alboniger TaxID=132473 RepID=A0A5J6HEC4_STRAD|nr:hypothetical protein [Streptomyces alboniger]QEV16711.1 hypothetical protein CP975_03635 [Streptomyces alboniger]
MAVRTLLASAGLGAALALGAVAAPAQAAPAQSAPTRSAPAQASASDVGILSCPPGAPRPRAGFRCLSPYSTEPRCDAGVLQHIIATPANEGYCQRSGTTWWGFVNIY